MPDTRFLGCLVVKGCVHSRPLPSCIELEVGDAKKIHSGDKTA